MFRFKSISVPCGECADCCRNVIVQLYDYDLECGFPYKKIKNKKADMDADPKLGEYRLSRQKNGGCTYFRNERCTIYENRPTVCRGFDCRNTIWGTHNRIGEPYTAEIEVEEVDLTHSEL